MIPTARIATAPIGMPVATAVTVPTGVPAYVRHLDLDGEYSVDPITGQFVGTSRLRQAVVIALQTQKGSCGARPDLGWLQDGTIGDDFELRTEAKIRAALAHVQRAGLGTVQRIDIARHPTNLGRVEIRPVIVPAGGTEPEFIGPFTL